MIFVSASVECEMVVNRCRLKNSDITLVLTPKMDNSLIILNNPLL